MRAGAGAGRQQQPPVGEPTVEGPVRRAHLRHLLVRILADGSGADWPLSRKFGAQPEVVFDAVLLARELELRPRGVSFHVGCGDGVRA